MQLFEFQINFPAAAGPARPGSKTINFIIVRRRGEETAGNNRLHFYGPDTEREIMLLLSYFYCSALLCSIYEIFQNHNILV